MAKYLVVTTKSWNEENFKKLQAARPGEEWFLITRKEDFTPERVAQINPRYVFFPHWSWMVSPEIYDKYECVVFHMTDLPYGRGGSPLQNLIARGHNRTKLSAIRVAAGADTGPIYFKADLSLDGTAEDILRRASDISFGMMPKFVETEPKPQPQIGEVVEFKRRKPEDGNIGVLSDPATIFNYIRMLDGEGYPPAWLETESLRLEFTNARLNNDVVTAQTKISLKNNRTVNTVLVIAAHPDDEILGVGGTLIKHVLAGDTVYCLILGEGAMSRENSATEMVSHLQVEAQAVGRIVGFKEMFFSNFSDNAFDTVGLLNITKEVEKYLEKLKPNIVYTHHENDLNIDHRLTFKAVLTASRPCNANYPKEIVTFETLSSTEWQSKEGQIFRPNYYSDIQGVLDKKIAAMREYKSEIREYPHPRSAEGIRILAQYRGLESGLKFAEALCVVRKVI